MIRCSDFLETIRAVVETMSLNEVLRIIGIFCPYAYNTLEKHGGTTMYGVTGAYFAKYDRDTAQSV